MTLVIGKETEKSNNKKRSRLVSIYLYFNFCGLAVGVADTAANVAWHGAKCWRVVGERDFWLDVC